MPKSVTYVLNLLCYLCPEPAPSRKGLSKSILPRQGFGVTGEQEQEPAGSTECRPTVDFAG
jgi:hypothetical protein